MTTAIYIYIYNHYSQMYVPMTAEDIYLCTIILQLLYTVFRTSDKKWHLNHSSFAGTI